MSNIDFKLDKAGVIEMLQSKEVLDLVDQKAREECASHPHHHVVSFVGHDRAKSILYLNTKRYPG